MRGAATPRWLCPWCTRARARACRRQQAECLDAGPLETAEWCFLGKEGDVAVGYVYKVCS